MTNGFIEAAYLSKSVHTDVTAGTTTYVVSFAGGMQPTDDIEVWVNGIKATSATVTWLSDSTLQLNGYTPVEGDDLEFRRVSPKDDNLVDLEAGKTIRAVSLMKNFRHALQVAQEAWDKSDADSAAAEAAAYAAEAAISADIIEPTKFAYNVDSVEALRLTPATEYTTVYLRGHTSVGDGGHGTFYWDATSTAADDNGVTIAVTGVATGRWIRQLNGFVTPEMFGGLSALAAYAPLSVILDSKVYALLNDITFPDPISKFIGQGYGRLGGVFDGSVITGDGGVIFAASAPQQGLSLADFALVYTGVGTALKISNFLNSQIKNVYLDLRGSGDTGLDYSGDNTYFSLLENCTITSFKGTGVKINSTGTKHVVRDCNIGSAQETTVAAVEINVPGVSIYDGQVNCNKTDGSGIGILFNNLSATIDHQGGLVQGTLSETDIGVKITGNTRRWYDVQLKNTRYTMGNTSKAVIFDMAAGCVLDHPAIYSPSVNYIAEFTANAIKCGVVGDFETCRAAMIVDAGATNCYKRCDVPILYTERALITTYANLTTIVDDCQYVGKTIHNGTSWDKFSVSIPDDSFATFAPPELFGTMEISSTSGGGDYILANYNVQAGSCSQIAVASSSAVNASNGTLTGTTGADGQLTVRCSSDGNVYVENRRGGSRRIVIHFKSPGPNT